MKLFKVSRCGFSSHSGERIMCSKLGLTLVAMLLMIMMVFFWSEEGWASPQNSKRPQLKDMMGYKQSWIDVDGVDTHYIEAGKGTPIVFVHGYGASSSGELNYGSVIAPLGKDFHTIAPDIVGFGYTTPRGTKDYTGQAQGDFLIRFLETLDVGPVHLGGNSHGGFLVQYVAHKRPDLIDRLIIINSMNGTYPRADDLTVTVGTRSYPSHTMDETRASIKRSGYNFTEERVKKYHETYERNRVYHKERTSAEYNTGKNCNKNHSYKGKHIKEWAGELKMPVLLLWSQPGSRLSWGVDHFFKIPGAEMHVFPWCAHHIQTSQTDRFVQVLTNWLQNEPARRPENR